MTLLPADKSFDHYLRIIFSMNGDYLPDLFGTDLNGNRTYWVYVPTENKNK